MQGNKKSIKISVIIPTLNRSELLKQTLESICKQTFRKEDFEVIVIDNGSNDDTKKVCMDYQKENGNLRYIYDDRPGLHIGRNRGFLESKSDILVYADDDIIACPTWLKAIYEGFKDPKTVLIGGNNHPCFERKPPKWVDELWSYNKKDKAKRLESFSVIEIGEEPRRVNPGMIFGCNFAVRKEIIKKAGGFHPDGVPDIYLKYRGDGESYITGFIRKYNMKAMFYPEASIHHMVTKQRLTKGYVEKVAYRTGISAGFARLRNISSIMLFMDLIGEAAITLFKSRIKKGEKNILKVKNFYFNKGFSYIVVQFCINRKVRKWIMRGSYINAEIPGSV